MYLTSILFLCNGAREGGKHHSAESDVLFIDFIRELVLHGNIPEWNVRLTNLADAVAALMAGILIFRKFQKHFNTY